MEKSSLNWGLSIAMLDHQRVFALSKYGLENISGIPGLEMCGLAVVCLNDTLWLFDIAMENGPFIDVFPIKTSIYKGFSMAMLITRGYSISHIAFITTVNSCDDRTSTLCILILPVGLVSRPLFTRTGCPGKRFPFGNTYPSVKHTQPSSCRLHIFIYFLSMSMCVHSDIIYTRTHSYLDNNQTIPGRHRSKTKLCPLVRGSHTPWQDGSLVGCNTNPKKHRQLGIIIPFLSISMVESKQYHEVFETTISSGDDRCSRSKYDLYEHHHAVHFFSCFFSSPVVPTQR